MSRRLGACFAGCLCLLLLAPMEKTEAESLSVSAGGAALIEAHSGRVLYEKEGDTPLPMASTTKIMTALLALEQGELEELITVPKEAEGTEGSSMYLKAGEKLSLCDLLYGLLLTSGNDAAVTIACHFGGSIEGFADRMNEKARELGCEHTHFVNPHGLHDANHYTSALDLCTIARAAMEVETFRTIVATQYYQTTTGEKVRTLKNKNKTLWAFEGGCGIKTGYTKKAGRCLVFSAEREGMLLMGVVLNCPNMWSEAFSLLQYGFDTYALESLQDAAEPLREVKVEGGVKKALPAVLKTGILYPIRKEGTEKITWEVSLLDPLTAPVEAGDVIGKLTMCLDGEAVAYEEILAGEKVSVPDFLWYWNKMTAGFF